MRTFLMSLSTPSDKMLSKEQITKEHDSEMLIHLFELCFKENHNTLLVMGDGEPIYLPATSEQKYHHIEFAHGYYSSALHEIAHWCIAGSERRLKVDYGYWYQPDGRTKEQQVAFEKVEIKPQALEWALSLAANFNFGISNDNLSAIPEKADWLYWTELQNQQKQFVLAVKNQLLQWLESGFPSRGKLLIDSLCLYYRDSTPITIKDVETSELWKRQCQHD